MYVHGHTHSQGEAEEVVPSRGVLFADDPEKIDGGRGRSAGARFIFPDVYTQDERMSILRDERLEITALFLGKWTYFAASKWPLRFIPPGEVGSAE